MRTRIHTRGRYRQKQLYRAALLHAWDVQIRDWRNSCLWCNTHLRASCAVAAQL